ncbi:hypothetical protein ACR777_20115 [Sphingobacterium spiritivorum]|uniref:RNA polymerase factor sigma-54 n=1 Tax=Sphingobacterium spiritivorum TaxID=258 RepID=UPI003DA3C370
MKSQLSTNSKQKIKEALPPDGMERIAKMLNVHVSTVSRALSNKGSSKTNTVIIAALEVIDLYRIELNELESKIENL